MGRSAKPRKAYRPRPPEAIKLRNEPWKVRAVFAPLEAILDQLEQQGTIDIANDDVAVFRDQNDGHWYDSAVAIMGVVEAYEIHERRSGRPLDLEPLRQLAKRLQYAMPITDIETAAARACLVRMRAETLEMTAGYAKQLIVDFQIMERLQTVQEPA